MTHLLSNVIDLLCWVLVIPAAIFVGYHSYERSADRRGLVRKWIITVPLVMLIWTLMHVKGSAALVTLLVLVPATVVLALMWTPNIIALLSQPLTGAFDGGIEEVDAKPFYFLAEGKRRQGLYAEAIEEVRKQLELFPGDFEGYMKMATIQMESLKDLPAAEASVAEFLAAPDRAPNEMVSALQVLADWKLQFGRDTDGARESLERIVQLYPGTSFAHAAQQRIARLVTTDEAREVRERGPLEIGTRERNIGLRKEVAALAVAADPNVLAEEYGKQLESHPSDTATREKLAVLYAEQFHRIDLAAAQLEQLIALPAEPPKHVAHWLNLLATLHIKTASDADSAQNALRRIIARFPGGALAEVANRRLATLKAELKGGQSTAIKVLPNQVK
jgi:tetratricopeptide (TPR) repeat protein